MVWFIVAACALGLLLAALVVTIIRFNQLSMARSLCDEAKRQLLVELRARHALVPAFIGTLQQITTADLSQVELALASAERAPFGARGAAAESALTRTIDEAALAPDALGPRAQRDKPARDSAERPAVGGDPEEQVALRSGMREELEVTVHLLHGQLEVLAERIAAGARIYNTNVERYHRQRRRLLSRLFGTVFKPREAFIVTGRD